MRPVAIDDVFKLKYLSEISFSPEGTSACFVVSEADMKKNGYKSFIWTLKDGKLKRLTGLGEERSFQYLDEDTLLFPGKRGDDDKESIETRYYLISLSGGEAELAFTFPIPVSEILPLPDGDFIVLGRVFPGFEDLYKGEAKRIAEYKKHVRDEADYEVIEQNPWWWNGSGVTKGSYSALYRFSRRNRKLTMLTEPGVNVSAPKLNYDKTAVLYIATPVEPRLKLAGNGTLMRLDLTNGSEKALVKDSEKFAVAEFAPAKDFILLMASDLKYGLNTDVDLYKISEAGGKPKLYAKYGEAIGSSVGSDVRYGGGRSFTFDGDAFYFISTRFDCAEIYKLEDGKIEQVTFFGGSTDCFDVKDGKILTIALKDMKPQEIYDGIGRRLSNFNVSAMRGRYVAAPEPLNVKRDGYDVHGFVLKPFEYDPSKRYPVIIDIHGGPKTVYGPVFYHEMQYWAGKGYFVIFCNPTGSDGRGSFMDIRGAYGTCDYDDIMAFCDAALAAYPAMDAENFFETGGSYGGFMTNWIIGHTDRFRACASQRSISNWFSFYGVSDIGVDFAADQNASDPWSDPEKLWWHSPMKYADKVKTPTLFIHSFEDYRCPIDQGYQMFTSLVAHGVETRMVCFRGENHELSRSGKPEHRLRRLREITEWFEKHKK